MLISTWKEVISPVYWKQSMITSLFLYSLIYPLIYRFSKYKSYLLICGHLLICGFSPIFVFLTFNYFHLFCFVYLSNLENRGPLLEDFYQSPKAHYLVFFWAREDMYLAEYWKLQKSKEVRALLMGIKEYIWKTFSCVTFLTCIWLICCCQLDVG